MSIIIICIVIEGAGVQYVAAVIWSCAGLLEMIGGKIEISDVADEKGILGKTNARNSAGPWQLQYRRGASSSSSYRSLELTSRISTATAWRNIVQLFITGL